MQNILRSADEAHKEEVANQPWLMPDVEEMLTEAKFKVLFSTNQERQNLKDYILKIYKSILEGSSSKMDKATK
jgi:hypothetical protein